MLNNSLYFLIVFLLFIHGNHSFSFGQQSFTQLSAQITETTHLYASLSPYLASDDVIISKKASLIIEPGTQIRFAKAKELIVHGTLLAKGNSTHRILFTNQNDQAATNAKPFDKRIRLVDGETIQDGRLQINHNSKWHYVCTTQFNWTEIDANITCKSLGFSNGTFYSYSRANNLTNHMKMYLPRCIGSEKNLFQCPGSNQPEIGRTVCENQNLVSLTCEGFDNEIIETYDNWGGILFEKYAPYLTTQPFSAAFYNVSKSVLEYVDIRYAGLTVNRNKPIRKLYDFTPGSAVTVFQYAPRLHNLIIEYSLGNGLNYSNIEAPAYMNDCTFRFNRGHGVAAKTRFGNLTIFNTHSYENGADGLKYYFNNTAWSRLEEEEQFNNRYLDYCDSQNPLSYPAYYRFRNPNYVRECSKTFSAESNLRITLHFQKVNIRSRFSHYWLEVYDGQTEQPSQLIANYTFENGKTPEAIYSRSSYMFVKLKFYCSYPTNRQLQPIELAKLEREYKWNEYEQQQEIYERKLYQYNHPEGLHIQNMQADRPWQEKPDQYVAPLSLSALTFDEQQKQLYLFEKNQKEKSFKFNQDLKIQQQQLKQARIFCPYASYDDITMFAMIGQLKHPDLVIKDSYFVNNSMNGINSTSLHSLIQINETTLSGNGMDGLHVRGGAGDVSLYHSKIESNTLNGINITYAGGLKEFNYSTVSNNGLYGIYINYDVNQEMDNVFQNTTLNSSLISLNQYGGVYLSQYCNQSNITVNATHFQENNQNGLVIESCESAEAVDWFYLDPVEKMSFQANTYKRYYNKTIKYVHLNISWNEFDANRLNGLKIMHIQNMIGIITNNTFRNHRKGALLITANQSKLSDSLIRNVSIKIQFNRFINNSGRYALNVAVNELADKQIQQINITFNRFEYNYMYDPYKNKLNSRSSVSGVAIVSSSRVAINQNWFNNPMSRLQIATHLENHTSQINASYNWFANLQPVYDLNYFFTLRDKCNQQWSLVRGQVFDQANRSSLAEVVYWPYACNEKLWFHESSNYLKPPADFDLMALDSLGGIFDLGDSVLPVNRYTVTNDILVKPNAKLTLKSGTELNFLNGIGMLILGELFIDGVQSSPVRFTLADQTGFNLRSIFSQEQNIIETTTRIPVFSNISSSEFLNISSDSPVDPIYSRKKSFKYGIELVDGRNSNEGRLKIEMNGMSGTVCNRGWTPLNSQIVCQQLGLILDPNLHLYSITRRENDQDQRSAEPILMSEVECDPLDTNLFECKHTNQFDHACTHLDDVWLRCLQPGWAGIRFGMMAEPSKLKYAVFENAGQYDYATCQLAPSLQFDFMQHEVTNITFRNNRYTSMEIIFNHPFKESKLYNLDFIDNNGAGLLTRSSFVKVHQFYAHGHLLGPAFEYNPYFDVKLVDSIRLYAAQPRRNYDVRKELTRLHNYQWHIGSEQIVLLYTDVDYEFGPQELNLQILTDNNRVIVVELIDFNPDFSQEKVLFCEKFCQQSLSDPSAREWNLSTPGNSIYFPFNTSFSVLHINYNVTRLKSGRLTLLVYSTKAPEPVYDYKNPSYIYIRNIMPDNQIGIINSTFFNNRHSIVLRHYDDSYDVFGSLRKRYNYTNIIISNCTFDSNDQVLWVNTDPVIPHTFYERAINFTIHEMHSLNEPSRDDLLISESGYQMYDLIPSVKFGPIGRINVTLEQSVLVNNYGGIRALYRYHEYSNTLWHYEIRNNKFSQNKQSVLRLLLPRIYRFAVRGRDWANVSHSVNLRSNEFSLNSLFEISIDGYYAQMNITKNLFYENECRIGLFKVSGTEKDFFIYDNHVERNVADFLFEMEAKSHADNAFDLRSLFADNIIQNNIKPLSQIQIRRFNEEMQLRSMRDVGSLFIANAPNSYAIAIRGIQNCSFSRNILDNKQFDYELIGAMSTNTLNSTVDATLNWWGSSNATLVKQRIFDMNEWNNHALVTFVPYCVNRHCEALSRAKPNSLIKTNLNSYILGGLIDSDLTLYPSPVPYQVKSDLTVLPGVTLVIEAGCELEFYPNVGILVLGDLRAVGNMDKQIKMRPVLRGMNRMPYFSQINTPSAITTAHINNKSNLNVKSKAVSTQIDAYYLSSSKYLRFFQGLNQDEGFLQVYNTTLRSWTWICDRQFTLSVGRIVCDQLGKESRNVLVKSIPYYMNPILMEPVWNQTFVCNGAERNLAECDTFANYHMSECRAKGEYTYVMCRPYNLNTDMYEHAWGGIRFSQPYYETYNIVQQQNMAAFPAQIPIFVRPEMQQLHQDNSVMQFVQVIGAGSLHNEQNPAVQVIGRTPLISDCSIKQSNFHGFEFVQTKSIATLSSNQIIDSLGYGLNSLQLNVQTTDQKTSYRVLKENTFSNQNTFSILDICDSHKYYNLDQRVIVFYKYSSIARDCVKIFRTKISADNLGATGQLGIRVMQLMLVNNTVQNDTLEFYNGTMFQQTNLMASLTNGSSRDDQEKFYLSRTDSLSLYMKASIGRELYGFIAEVLVYPTSQYLSTENYIEIADSEMNNNQFGALSYVSAGERSPHLYVLRNRFVSNGFELYNTTSLPCIDVIMQNTPKFYFGNNYLAYNYGGLSTKLHSGSGVLITSTVIYNNLFYLNRNDSILCSRGELELPYNELTVDKNLFIENKAPRSDLILISGLLSKFSRNQIIYNTGMRILFTQGFENVSTPRNQEIAFNLIRDNYAFGIINDLEDPNRFRSTMVAGSVKQTYHANYMFNPDNDFELTALVDPLSIYYMKSLMTSTPHSDYYWDDWAGKYYPKDYNRMPASELANNIDPSILNNNNINNHQQNRQQMPPTIPGQIAYTGIINASFNYWGAQLDTEIRSRIRDKYDNQTLFEIIYSPAIEDKFRLRDGKCELGWTLIDDTCYSYFGSYVNYREAEFMCKKFESRLARETVAPIKLPRFRILARTSQFNYEGQSFRRMWLYTDVSVSRDPSICAVVEDYGVAYAKCYEMLPFICEKDPVFLGAKFRFKDEIAFAIAAGGALLACIILLSLLWLYKSKKKKKEHLERQNTLRTSARSHRHMINNSSNLSTNLNSNSNLNKSALFSQAIGNSTDNLASTRGGLNASSRSINSGIAYSQRNQYFSNKKHKEARNEQLKHFTKSKENIKQLTSSFIATGLDNNNSNSTYYGENNNQINNDKINSFDDVSTTTNQRDNLTSKTELTNQYHMYDASNTMNSVNKTIAKFYSNNPVSSEETGDDDDDTTTDDITDDTTVTKQDLNRFIIKKQSPTQLSVRTQDTYAETIPTIQPRNQIHKPSHISPPTKQSTPNMSNNKAQLTKNYNPISYDKIMNLTADEDDLDVNSRRLLTNKVNTSYNLSIQAPKQNTKLDPISTLKIQEQKSNQQDESILSKSTTNITNISSLTNQSQTNITNNYNFQTTSDYENLSNFVIDDKFYSTKRNILTNSNLLQLASPTTPQKLKNSAPVPPPTRPPPIPASIGFKLNPQNNDTDSESIMSCQLITSANLLLNRESVREATTEKFINKAKQNNLPNFTPRHNTQSAQTQTILPSIPLLKNPQQSTNNQLKPPPLETTI